MNSQRTKIRTGPTRRRSIAALVLTLADHAFGL